MSVSINGTGGITFADASTQSTGGYTGFRNRIINGAMMIDQRNAGASVSSNSATNPYTLDRWRSVAFTGSGQFSVQQNAGSVTPPVGFVSYLGATSLASTTVGSNDYYLIRQPIEGNNTADFGWGTANAQTVTLSFWVRSSLTGAFGGALGNQNATRSYPFSYVINSANTWEYKTVTVTGDTTGTWPTDNSGSINLWLGLGVGTSKSGTAGSWAAADYRSATGATSVVGTSGATFYITGVQLEKGSVATPFEFRPYGTELELCQRYGRPWGPTLFGRTYSATLLEVTVPFNVPMRASPTMTFGGVPNSTTAVNQTGVSSQTVSAIAYQSTNPESAYMHLTTSGATAGSVLASNSGTSLYLGFASAEL